VVRSVDGTQTELFAKAEKVLKSMLSTTVVKYVLDEPSTITIQRTDSNPIRIRYCGRNLDGTVNSRISIRFKDGKVRVDVPTLLSYIHRGKDGKVAKLVMGKGKYRNPIHLGQLPDEEATADIYVYKENGNIRIDDAVTSLESYFNDFIHQFLDGMSRDSKVGNDW
jgi:hypothetical protein